MITTSKEEKGGRSKWLRTASASASTDDSGSDNESLESC